MKSKITAHQITHGDCLFIAERMRQADKEEIYATRHDDSPISLVWDCLKSASFAWTIGKDCPICAVGAYCMWPGVWGVWMFATDRFPEIGLFTTKFIKKNIISALIPVAHRAQCYSAESHTEAHKWLEVLGARKEAVLKDYGKEGQTFYLYRWSQYVHE